MAFLRYGAPVVALLHFLGFTRALGLGDIDHVVLFMQGMAKSLLRQKQMLTRPYLQKTEPLTTTSGQWQAFGDLPIRTCITTANIPSGTK
jgi:hypothetical protein